MNDIKIILSLAVRGIAGGVWMMLLITSIILPWWVLLALWITGAVAVHVYWFWDIGLTEFQGYRHWSLVVGIVLWPLFFAFQALPDLAEQGVEKLLRINR